MGEVIKRNMRPRRTSKKYQQRTLNMSKFTFYRKQPIPEAVGEELFINGLKLLEGDPQVRTLEEIYCYLDMPSKTFYNLIKRYEICKDIYEHMKSVISYRRENGALTRELDPGLVGKSMALYNDRWKDLEEWRSKLRQREEENQDKTVYIIKEAIPDTGIKPPKDKDEKQKENE